MPRSSIQTQQLMPSQTVADSTSYPWTRYYGTPPYISKDLISSEYQKRTSAPDLPAAYIGESNYYIPSIVEELVMTTDNWYTTVAAPIRFTDQITWEFNKTTYDTRLPRNTPHKGTSRILDYRKRKRAGRLHRKGMAYEMEADFMDTAAGQEHYAFTLNQLANGIIMDINIGVINAYLNANAYRRREEQVNGMPVSLDFEDKIEREVTMFAIIQKTKGGLKKLDVLAEEMMLSWQGSANMWIMPPKIKQWNQLVPPENTDFFMNGYRQPIDSTDATVPMATLNGKPVYLCRMMDTSMEFAGKRNLLAREREIGNFYTMCVGKRRGCSGADDAHHWKTAMGTIKVYDQDTDDWAYLTLKDAHDNCHVFDADGNVEMPRHERAWANIADRSKDMLSYDDVDGQRKPVRLFGHLSRNHCSTKTVLDICKSVACKIHKTGGSHMDPACVETALKEGMDLFRKISDRTLTWNWFFNVTMERLLRGPMGGQPLADPGDAMSDDTWRSVINSMTNPTERTSAASRYVNNVFLPSFDYYSVLAAGDAAYARRTTTDPGTGALTTTLLPGTAAALSRAAENTGRLGGNTGVGSLAGFGNWDGFLALQSELNSGSGSSPGYTKHGYLRADCEIADRYVKTVRAICNSAQFLFQNEFYLDRQRAPNYVESPTIEHVVSENILGMGGLPVWLDLSSVSALLPVAEDQRGTPSLPGSSADVLNDLKRQSNLQVLAIEQFLASAEGNKIKGAEVIPTIRARLNLVFGSAELDDASVLNSDAYNYDGVLRDYRNVAVGSPTWKFLTRFFPLYNASTATATYESVAERTVLVDVVSKMILDNPGLDDVAKLGAIASFFDKVIREFDLALVVSENKEGTSTTLAAMADWDYTADAATQKAAIAARLTAMGKKGADWESAQRKKAPNVATASVLDWLVAGSRNSKSLVEGLKDSMDVAQYVQDAKADVAAAMETDRRNYEAKPNIAPILFMAGTQDLNFNGRRDKRQAAGGSSVLGAGSASFIGGDVGSKKPRSAEEQRRRKALLQAWDASATGGLSSRFYRSTLSLSPKQIVELKGLLDANVSTALGRLRVSDPSDPAERFVDPGRMSQLVKRIEELNDGDLGKTAMQHEPYFLFHPEKSAVRDVTLSSMVGKLETARKYATVSKDHASHHRGYKRSRGDGYGDVTGPRKSQKTHTSRISIGEDSDSDDYADAEGYGTVKSRGGSKVSLYGDDRPSSEAFYPGEMGGGMDDDMDAAYEAVDLTAFRRTVGIDSSNDLLTPDLIATIVDLGGKTDSLYTKVLGKLYLTSKFNKTTITRFIDNDIMLGWGYIALQLHKRYICYAGILVQGGESTAVTLVGHSGLALQNDAATKTHFGHFTTYDQTVVLKENNVLVVYDIFMDGVLGGAGVKPIHPHHYKPEEGKTGGGSLIYIMVPHEEDISTSVLDATGRFAVAEDGNFVDQKRMSLCTYSQNWRANLKWHFRRMGSAAYDCEIPIDGNAPVSNFVAFQGQQYNYYAPTGDYTDLITNKGHLGEEGPGSLACRKGGLETAVKRKTVTIN